MSDPSEELVEVVGPTGDVLEITTRGRVRAEGLRHRCIYVAVLVGQADSLTEEPELAQAGLVTSETEVIVHQRADWKDTCPSYWDVAFGGLCGVGEDWGTAAERELAEEAGIIGASLLDLGSCSYETEANRIVGRIFLTLWPDEPAGGDGEVVAIDRVKLGGLGRWVDGRPVCPDSAELVVPRLLGLAGIRH